MFLYYFKCLFVCIVKSIFVNLCILLCESPLGLHNFIWDNYYQMIDIFYRSYVAVWLYIIGVFKHPKLLLPSLMSGNSPLWCIYTDC